MANELENSVKHVLELLTAGRFSELESLTRGTRLNAQAMADVIANYGRQLVMPPPAAFQMMDVVEVRNAHPAKWSVVIPLWTVEEGRSDLSLELTIIGDQEPLGVELDDIRVL